MSTIKRIDPRRPYAIAASGLRRITLGQDFVAGAASGDAHALSAAASHGNAPKPRRMAEAPGRVLLVAVHSERGALDEHARQVLAAAAIVADACTEVVLVVFGELTDDPAELGADKVVELPTLGRAAFTPQRSLAALVCCVKAFEPAHLLMPDNATGDGDLGRRFAAHTRASIATHVVEIDAAHVAAYVDAGRRIAARAWPQVVLLAPDAVDARLPFVGRGERIAFPALQSAKAAAGDGDERDSAADRYGDLGTTQLGAAELALEEADFIVAAGNGVTDIAAFEGVARAFGAAIGASRVAVDNGHFSRDKQVGATGKTVGASVYIAFGISGAVQHLQGIKDCRHVIAVNLDASAPIAKRANLTVVADTRETIAALTHAVAAARGGAHTLRGATLPPVIKEGVAA